MYKEDMICEAMTCTTYDYSAYLLT